MILKTEFHAKNTITTIGALAVQVLRHSFGIISCRLEGKQNRQLNIKTLIMYKMHHPKANIDRLYDKTKGRGFLQTEAKYKADINIAE
jgi:hypothetical protein